MAPFYCAGGGRANRGTIPAVKFGLLPPYRTGVTADPQWITTFARAAEACGFESLYVAEHVVVPAGYTSRYPYSDTGRMTLPDNADIPDPLDLLAFVAGATTTLGLGTGLLVLPEHHPVQLAKRLATLDRLSNGRLVVGVGVGWLREELEAMDVDPVDARRTRRRMHRSHARPVARRRSDVPRTVLRLRTRVQLPEAAQPDRSRSTSAATARPRRRAPGASATASIHSASTASLSTERLDQMRAAADEAGRDADAIELTLGGLLDQLDDDRLAAVEKHGAVRLVLSTRERDIDKAAEQLDRFADRFIR